jgi:hypothetical protein
MILKINCQYEFNKINITGRLIKAEIEKLLELKFF